MPKQAVSKIQFMDGVPVDDEVVAFIAGDLQSGNYNLTRMCVLKHDDKWFYWDFGSVVVSVCATAVPRQLWGLGRDGKIWYKASGVDAVEERIPDAGTGKGKHGYLSQIRAIAGKIYACGDEGQVYVRTPKGWIHMDDGLLETKDRDDSNCHNGIDGTSADDIYVVGEYGRIFHFNGKKWSDVSFETNCHLERVRSVSREEVYVCGANGILLRGNHRGWKQIGDADAEEHIWDLEFFQGRLYLVVDDRLKVFDGREIKPVDTKLKPQIDAHRLSSRAGVLWSFGENDLARFDGMSWTRVVHPDNIS